MTVRKLVTVSPMVAPEGSELWREPPRQPALRQDDYAEKFDFRTVFYDVYWSGRAVRTSGPPMRTMAPALRAASWSLAGKRVRPRLMDVPGGQNSVVHRRAEAVAGGRDSRLLVDGGDWKLEASVSADGADLFAGRTVLLTEQRNERLEWIRDWVDWHVRLHRFDAVLIYDNGSTDYTSADLLDALDGCDADVVVVVNWPFTFGPQGGLVTVADGRQVVVPWDSSYCQLGMLHHARHRFLRQALIASHHDVDELIMTVDGRPLRQHVMESGSDGIIYNGVWIEPVSDAAFDSPRHRDFDRADVAARIAARKWAVKVRGTTGRTNQWRNHDIVGAHLEAVVDVYFCHFTAIGTGWKFQSRTAFGAPDPTAHRRVEHLVRGFEAMGWLPASTTVPALLGVDDDDWTRSRRVERLAALRNVADSMRRARWRPSRYAAMVTARWPAIGSAWRTVRSLRLRRRQR